MFYVYVLQSKKDYNLYFGQTKDLKRRFSEHNTGKVSSTKSRQPFVLVYYEAYLNHQDALKREKQIKESYFREEIRERLVNSLNNGEVA